MSEEIDIRVLLNDVGRQGMKGRRRGLRRATHRPHRHHHIHHAHHAHAAPKPKPKPATKPKVVHHHHHAPKHHRKSLYHHHRTPAKKAVAAPPAATAAKRSRAITGVLYFALLLFIAGFAALLWWLLSRTTTAGTRAATNPATPEGTATREVTDPVTVPVVRPVTRPVTRVYTGTYAVTGEATGLLTWWEIALIIVAAFFAGALLVYLLFRPYSRSLFLTRTFGFRPSSSSQTGIGDDEGVDEAARRRAGKSKTGAAGKGPTAKEIQAAETKTSQAPEHVLEGIRRAWSGGDLEYVEQNGSKTSSGVKRRLSSDGGSSGKKVHINQTPHNDKPKTPVSTAPKKSNQAAEMTASNPTPKSTQKTRGGANGPKHVSFSFGKLHGNALSEDANDAAKEAKRAGGLRRELLDYWNTETGWHSEAHKVDGDPKQKSDFLTTQSKQAMSKLGYSEARFKDVVATAETYFGSKAARQTAREAQTAKAQTATDITDHSEYEAERI